MRSTLPILLAAASGALAAPAAADTPLVTDPTVANVTAYGSTTAWSRRADDGSHRLVIRSAGTVADAPVPPSSAPYDPNLGPTSANGRVIVYARGGDLYEYAVGAASERRIAALSGRYREGAPSFFKGAIAFARFNSPRPGLYLYRPGRGPARRLSRRIPVETDVAATRVAWAYVDIGVASIYQTNYAGDTMRRVAHTTSTDTVFSSPFLSRFNVYWIQRRRGSDAASVHRVGVNAHRGLRAQRSTRSLPGRTTSIGGTAEPEVYTNGSGVMRVDPHLRFAAPGPA